MISGEPYRRLALMLAIAAQAFLLESCLYSFRGSSVPPHLKTVAISLFDDQSGSGEPGLREKFTNKLIDKFRQDNSLQVSDKTHSDSIIEGTITTVSAQPLVVAAGETVTKMHLVIAAQVTYQDMKLRKKVFDKQFSNWGDYEASGGLENRQSAVNTALDKLCEDILNDTVSGW